MPDLAQTTNLRLPRFPRLEKTDGTKLLVESSKLFAASLDCRVIYESFKHVIQGAMDCDGLLISAYNPQTSMIRCDFAWVDGKYLDHAAFPPVRCEDSPGRGMQSEVIRTGEARLFEDIVQRVEEGRGKFFQVKKDGSVAGLPKGSKPDSKSAIMAPLKLDEQVIGVVQVMTDHGGAYTETHKVFVEGLALQMAAALKNAELFAKMQEEIAERIKVEQALREQEEEVRRLNEQLERRVVERTAELRLTNAEMEGFCYSVSHDLRAPLRGISAASMMLIEDYSEVLDDEGKEHLRSLRASADKMSKLIDGLLNFSRLGRNDMERGRVDLSEIATRISEGLRTAYPRTVVSIAPGLVVLGDHQMWTLAIENLLSNAFKFSAPVESPRIEFGKSMSQSATVFFVRDNGVGFEQAYIAKLFRPFERLHAEAEFPGTGIGLANVKRIVERHGGKIWAESGSDGGAAFYFSFEANSPKKRADQKKAVQCD